MVTNRNESEKVPAVGKPTPKPKMKPATKTSMAALPRYLPQIKQEILLVEPVLGKKHNSLSGTCHRASTRTNSRRGSSEKNDILSGSNAETPQKSAIKGIRQQMEIQRTSWENS